MVEAENPFTSIARAHTIISQLTIKPGMSILDVGCGPGRLTIPLAHATGPKGNVVALDTQKDMLKKVDVKAADAGLSQVKTIHATIGTGHPPVTTQKFDRITLVAVLGEIPNQQQALTEIGALLKPDGILSITELIFDPHFQRKKTIRTLAHDCGLQETACFGSWYAYTMHLKLQQLKNGARLDPA
jgi:ubiquinone/menaquinone biosynthesis C-methylase UbiE